MAEVYKMNDIAEVNDFDKLVVLFENQVEQQFIKLYKDKEDGRYILLHYSK